MGLECAQDIIIISGSSADFTALYITSHESEAGFQA